MGRVAFSALARMPIGTKLAVPSSLKFGSPVATDWSSVGQWLTNTSSGSMPATIAAAVRQLDLPSPGCPSARKVCWRLIADAAVVMKAELRILLLSRCGVSYANRKDTPVFAIAKALYIE